MEKLSVGFVSADWGKDSDGDLIPGGAGYVRIHVPAGQLHALGHDVAVGSQVGAIGDGRLIPATHDMRPLYPTPPSVVVMQRWMWEGAADVVRQARAAGQVVVQDVDDWFWGLDQRNAAFRSTDPRRRRDHNRKHYQAVVEASDAVTVSSEFLARRIRERFGVRTILLRNVVDRRSFLEPQPVSERDSELTVAWVGGLAWRSGDLETLNPYLGQWLEATDSKFLHHGASPHDPHPAWALLGLSERHVAGWRPMVHPELYASELMRGFDIGLVPLNDVPFNHAKSWIKGLEYAAAGIPFVARRTAEYEALGAGLLYETGEEFLAQMNRLRDPEFRRHEQKRGLAVAAEHDVRERVGEWVQAYSSLLPARV